MFENEQKFLRVFRVAESRSAMKIVNFEKFSTSVILDSPSLILRIWKLWPQIRIQRFENPFSEQF